MRQGVGQMDTTILTDIVRGKIHPHVARTHMIHRTNGSDQVVFDLSDGSQATINERDIYQFLVDEGLIQWGFPPSHEQEGF